jgi:peptidyl-prolyl cis-trans isomerase A (cyclophilin A)
MADKKSKKKAGGETQPKAARPANDRAQEKRPEPQDPANYFVPAVLGLGVVVAIGLWAKANTSPPEPAAVRTSESDMRPSQGVNERPSPAPVAGNPTRAPTGGFVLPTPQPAAPNAGDPLQATAPQPTTPDPRQGRFSLAEATEGMPAGDALVADIETNYGTFACDLWPERAPNTVANFVGLARGKRDFWDPASGAWVRRPYYDGTVFHRVIPNFMIQGGDIMRNGRGGPGYEFADENTAAHNLPGMLCMANHGPSTNGSQFFILEEPKQHLDGSYSVFGRCSPVDLVRAIARVPSSPENRPNSPVVIRAIRVHR